MNSIHLLFPVAFAARKERYEKQLKLTDAALSTVELIKDGLESAVINSEVLRTMKMTSDSLKGAHNPVNFGKNCSICLCNVQVILPCNLSGKLQKA